MYLHNGFSQYSPTEFQDKQHFWDISDSFFHPMFFNSNAVETSEAMHIHLAKLNHSVIVVKIFLYFFIRTLNISQLLTHMSDYPALYLKDLSLSHPFYTHTKHVYMDEYAHTFTHKYFLMFLPTLASGMCGIFHRQSKEKLNMRSV